MADNNSFSNLDFEQVKLNLRDYLRSQSQFKDYDFEGSNMAVLIDLLAYNTFNQNVYNNMMFSEMFMDSVQLRENALSRAKELNYTARSIQSAAATLDIEFNTRNTSPSVIDIPKGTRFTAVCGKQTFNFVTDRSYNVKPVDGRYAISGMTVYEGRTVKEYYTVDDSVKQQFIINNVNADISSVRVSVRANSNPNTPAVEYFKREDIFGVAQDDNIFYTSTWFEESYQIEFGRDRFGRQPKNGEIIEIEYRVTKGSEANGATNFSPVANIGGQIPSITNSPIAVNGADAESIEDIKFFAPKSIQVQERAVTKSDYEILLKQAFPSIETISVYGGDEVDPPRFGKVIISVDVLGSDGAGEDEIRQYREFIQDKTPLTIEPIFVPAKFMYIDLELIVTYDQKLTSKSDSGIEQVVRDAITGYSTNSLNKFNITLRQSRLSAAIDASDTAIVSTDIVAKPIIEYIPVINDLSSPTFDFQTELVKPYRLNEALGFTNFKPSITSSVFSINGTPVTLIDNGNGQVHAVTANTNQQEIFKRNIGFVDYVSGKIRFTNFQVSSFVGNAIKIIANSKVKDITGPKDRIIALRDSDVSVTVNTVS